MMLAPVGEVVDSLGFQTMTDITTAAAFALDAATAMLQATLETDFDRGDFIDTFYVTEPRYRVGSAAQVEFRLSRGLIDTVTSILVCSDPTQFGTSDATDVTANAIVDNDRGVVKDWKTTTSSTLLPSASSLDFMSGYTRKYVQISYSAGFDPDPSLPDSYRLDEVPDWLQKAAKLAALYNLADNPILSEAQIKLDKTMLARQYDLLCSRKRRYAPVALLPL